MSLGVGARLGHYQVTAKLGEGGMAEVCQVRDVVGDPLSVNRRSWVSVVLLLCALVGPLGSVAAGVAHAGQAGRVRRQEGRVTARPGAMLPMLELPSTSGRVVNLTAKAGDGPLVLFFYPGDRSPYPELAGCTAEACSFRDSQVAFQQLDTTVYGVNLHTTDRQREFLDREHLVRAFINSLTFSSGTNRQNMAPYPYTTRTGSVSDAASEPLSNCAVGDRETDVDRSGGEIHAPVFRGAPRQDDSAGGRGLVQ